MNKILENIKSALLNSSPELQVSVAAQELNKLDLDSVLEILKSESEIDNFSLSFKVMLSPPHVLPLATFSGFSIEIIHWLYSDNVSTKDDNEDIHDHFGIIVSKALAGNPYFNVGYELLDGNKLTKTKEFYFSAGDIHVINQDDIHQVFMRPDQSALTIRIVFPPTKKFCTVYDRNGLIIRRIENSIDKKNRAIAEMMRYCQLASEIPKLS
jgi:hypothetical protein